MLSVSHLIVIFVVALVIFGPEKLPELARNLGKVMAEFKRITGEMRYTFEDHLRELERETEQRKAPAAAALPPPPPAAENTIASNPPHGVTPAAVAEEPAQPGLFDPHAEVPPTESSAAAESSQPAQAPESHQENPISDTTTVNDGGVRPA
ncbi:MAG: Sec-independent protein translocase subunit TatA/TatB [Candidatus Acidiferrales bacterium]